MWIICYKWLKHYSKYNPQFGNSFKNNLIQCMLIQCTLLEFQEHSALIGQYVFIILKYTVECLRHFKGLIRIGIITSELLAYLTCSFLICYYVFFRFNDNWVH